MPPPSHPAERLWQRALVAAARRGLLPAAPDRQTPAELAREAGRRGEPRLERLVRDYYYPAAYGLTAGPLSEADAIALVAALEAGRPAAASPPVDVTGNDADGTAVLDSSAVLCPACRKRLPEGSP